MLVEKMIFSVPLDSEDLVHILYYYIVRKCQLSIPIYTLLIGSHDIDISRPNPVCAW